MALDNGVFSVGIATILCAVFLYFLHKKYRDRKVVIFHIVFCIGVYNWIVHNFFPLPLTLSFWKMTLIPVVRWSNAIYAIPFYDIYDIFNRFGFNERTLSLFIKDYVTISTVPLLLGFSIKGAYIKIKKLHVFLLSTFFSLFPFIVYSAFVVFGSYMWKRAYVTSTLLLFVYFWIGYGVYSLIKKLWRG